MSVYDQNLWKPLIRNLPQMSRYAYSTVDIEFLASNFSKKNIQYYKYISEIRVLTVYML